ncbi:MAG: hypothetical protein KUG79_16690 [Pseudomonadales bacterium]|nr:hypothetical protein [Pseudomonadales bacterium]
MDFVFIPQGNAGDASVAGTQALKSGSRYWSCRANCVRVVLMLMASTTLVCTAAMDLSDPTRPLNGLAASLTDSDVDAPGPTRAAILGSVLIGPDRRVAIINGRAYEANDLVGEYRLTQIVEDSVTLVKGSERLELRLAGTTFKRKVKPLVPFSAKGPGQ